MRNTSICFSAGENFVNIVNLIYEMSANSAKSHNIYTQPMLRYLVPIPVKRRSQSSGTAEKAAAADREESKRRSE